MATSRKITLRSSDGESFDVEQAVAEESQVIRSVLEMCPDDKTIPLPNVNSKILAKVMEYCKMHVESAKAEDPVNDEELKTWDVDFVKVDQATLFDLIMAANYLDIKSLLDLTSQTVADMVKGKTPEEMREIWGVENDFTPEEEAKLRQENPWAFE